MILSLRGRDESIGGTQNPLKDGYRSSGKPLSEVYKIFQVLCTDREDSMKKENLNREGLYIPIVKFGTIVIHLIRVFMFDNQKSTNQSERNG